MHQSYIAELNLIPKVTKLEIKTIIYIFYGSSLKSSSLIQLKKVVVVMHGWLFKNINSLSNVPSKTLENNKHLLPNKTINACLINLNITLHHIFLLTIHKYLQYH